MLYVVKYTGKFGFIKPWTAVRDGKTYSQQFLTPSIIEGIEKKLFPETLSCNGEIRKIKRYKLRYSSIDLQQEQIQARQSSLGQAGLRATIAPLGMTISILEAGRRRIRIPLPALSNGGFWTTRPTPGKPAFSCSPTDCLEQAIMAVYISITQARIATHGRAATRRRGAIPLQAVISIAGNLPQFWKPQKATMRLPAVHVAYHLPPLKIS